MTYIATDASTQSGDLVYLFLFVYEGVEYRLTNQAVDVVAMGETWVSAPVRAGRVSVSDDMIKDELKIDFARDYEFAFNVLTQQQEQQATLTVFRGYRTDGNYVTWWKGRVSGKDANASQITLTCTPIFTSLQRPGLRARYQRNCRHALYGRGCNVDPDDFLFATEITDISGIALTVAGIDAQDDGYYAGGVIVDVATGVRRFIKAHLGQQITISLPFIGWSTSESSGISVEVFPGCNRSVSDCFAKFDNLDNFGGFPYIPSINPFAGKSIV